MLSFAQFSPKMATASPMQVDWPRGTTAGFKGSEGPAEVRNIPKIVHMFIGLNRLGTWRFTNWSSRKGSYEVVDRSSGSSTPRRPLH